MFLIVWLKSYIFISPNTNSLLMKNLYAKLQGANIIPGFYLMAKGSALQELAKVEPSQYTWATGHLLDIGVAGILMSLVLAFQDTKKSALVGTILGSAAMCANEGLEYITNKGTADYQDCLCYLGVAGVAYAYNRILHKTFGESQNFDF